MSRQAAQGKNSSILLIALPIGMIIWVVMGDVRFPLDQVSFILKSFGIGTASFFSLWLPSFWHVRRDRTILATSALLFFLWNFATILGVARLNVELDRSPIEFEKISIVRSQKLSGVSSKGASTPTCLVWMEKPLLGVEATRLPYADCELIVPGRDRVEFQVRAGGLGMAWVTDTVIHKGALEAKPQ